MHSDQATLSAPNRLGTLVAFMVGHFSHHLCTAAMVPLLPMIRDSLQLDYFQTGLLLSAFSLVYGVSQLPLGALSDRLGARVVVALGLLVTGLACLGAGLSRDYAQLMAAMILMGLAASSYHAPASAFLSQVFGKAARGRSLGVHVVGGTSGLMAAPFVAILLANVSGSWRTSFLAMGVPALAAGLLVLVYTRAQEAATLKAAAEEQSEPIDFLKLARLLGFLVAVAMLTQLVVSGMNSYLPLYLVDKHGAPRDIAGLVMGIVFGAGVIGAPIGGALSDRIGRKPVILLSIVGIGPLIYAITVLPFGWLMAAAIAAYGMVLIFRLPVMESMIADLVPARRRATVLGAYYFLSQEATGVSTPFIGWAVDQYGLDNSFGVLALVAVGCSALVVVLWRKI